MKRQIKGLNYLRVGDEKRCATCHAVKDVADFPKQKGRCDGLNPNCPQCRSSINAEYHARNIAMRTARKKAARQTPVGREKERAYAKHYRECHPRPPRSPQEKKPRKDRRQWLSFRQSINKDCPGFVYLAECEGFYKIGLCTTDMETRRIGLQSGCPFEIRIIHNLFTADCAALEAYWHLRFFDKRHRNEWFVLTEQDVEEFKRPL